DFEYTARTWSEEVSVTPGQQYQAEARIYSLANVKVVLAITFSDGTSISSAPTYVGHVAYDRVTVVVIAPSGVSTAHISLYFTTYANNAGGTNNSFYVGYAALSGGNVLTSLTNDAGTDEFGNSYPAGLNTQAVCVGGFPFVWQGISGTTDSNGKI